MTPKLLKQISELDAATVAASKGIKILSSLSWPASQTNRFLSSWKRKSPKLPKIQHPKFDLKDNISALSEIMRKSLNIDHPVGRYLHDNALSYLTAARMLESVGTQDFVRFSTELYGRPDDSIGKNKVSHLHAAEHFIKMTSEYTSRGLKAEQTQNLSPDEAANKLRQLIRPLFKNKLKIKIEIDSSLASKAVANSQRIRLRKLSKFSELEINQLAQHEAFVHSLTLFNGRSQIFLPSLGMGSPRTTRTQEGLATLAELLSMTMEIGRLRRLALRTKAVQAALEGADFIEVFRLFLDSGQNETESFYSSMRVFRGGNVRGSIAFTKDIVYLQGLIEVHSFMRHALHHNKVEHIRYLFAGRLDVGDINRFESMFGSKYLREPELLPPWAQSMECLAAHFGYLGFAHELDFTSIYDTLTE